MFAALFRADLGFVARRLNKPISVRFTRHVLVAHADHAEPDHAVRRRAGRPRLRADRHRPLRCHGRLGLACSSTLQSMLDGCDGELARVRFQQSKLGAWLDTFVDDVLNVLITVAVGHRPLARRAPGAWAAGGRLRRRRDAGRSRT